jgi:hypothetical protein
MSLDVVRMDMNMNMEVDFELDAVVVSVFPSPKKKKVTFAEGTKVYDGIRDKDTLYHKVFLGVFDGKIANSFDVYTIIKHKPWLIYYFLQETIIITLKLMYIKLLETTYKKLKKYFPVPVAVYTAKDMEEAEIMAKWDIIKYNVAAHKKCNVPQGVGVVRKGSRIHSEKVMTAHIPKMFTLIKVLKETMELIQKKQKPNV